VEARVKVGKQSSHAASRVGGRRGCCLVVENTTSMNRHHFLIALAVVVPLAMFVAAKQITVWRPTKMGVLNGNIRRYMPVEIHAFDDYVTVGADSEDFTRFDLKTGAQNPLRGVRFSADDARYSYLALSDRFELRLSDASGRAVSYRTSDAPAKPFTNAALSVPDVLRVSKNENRVELLSGGHYFRWNKSLRSLERDVVLRDDNSQHFTSYSNDFASKHWALTRDSESAVYAGASAILFFSTRTGRVTNRVLLEGVEFFETIRVSPFGHYALYEAPGQKSYFEQRVVNSFTGRSQWSLKMDSNQTDAAFSPDETQIAVPIAKRKIWEVRSLETGKITRTLPLVTGTQTGAFSPDGATLYSVANGVLYRQRAR